jgi:hypothetical protein
MSEVGDRAVAAMLEEAHDQLEQYEAEIGRLRGRARNFEAALQAALREKEALIGGYEVEVAMLREELARTGHERG